jgi:hypothetical protein
MVPVVAFGQCAADKAKPTWQDLARLPCVLPPPWASRRVKLEQQFHKHGLQPWPTDLVETAVLRSRRSPSCSGAGPSGLHGARSVARHFEDAASVRVPALRCRSNCPRSA